MDWSSILPVTIDDLYTTRKMDQQIGSAINNTGRVVQFLRVGKDGTFL